MLRKREVTMGVKAMRACLVFLWLIPACGPPSGGSTVDTGWESRTRAQFDEYDRQAARATAQQAKVDEQQAKVDEQNHRFDKLLDKWEEQARRQDAILDAMEKRADIK